MPIGNRIFATFGDADCRTAFLVPSTPSVARKILDGAETKAMTFVDPDREFVTSLGLERLPAFVHLRQNTTLANVAEGWDAREWQRVARDIGKAMAWTYPEIARPTDPPATDGWPAAAPEPPATRTRCGLTCAFARIPLRPRSPVRVWPARTSDDVRASSYPRLDRVLD